MTIEASGAAAVLDGGAGGDGGQGGGDGGAAAAAAAAAAGGGDGGQGDGGADPEWYGSLAEQLGEGETASNRDYVKAKGFKDLDGLVKAYRAAEKGLHDSGRVKVPGEGASDDEVAAYHKAIGVPDDAGGYEVKLPETNGGLELDTATIDTLAGIAHKAGVPKAGFEAIANAYVEAQVARHLETVQREDSGRDALLASWGAQKDQKLAEANSAMRALGFSKDDVAALQVALGTPEKAGSARVLEMLQKIGAGIAEDVLATGGTGRFGITVSEAQAELNKMKADPDMAGKVATPGSPENLRWNRLLEIVAQAEAGKA